MAAAAALLGSPASPSEQPDAATPQSPDETGLPVLELFLRPSDDGGEGYEQQAVALYAPDASLTQEEAAQVVEEGADVVAETIAEMINAGELVVCCAVQLSREVLACGR